ncbi:MAG: EAL domain-containing protein [Rhodocyclaceae bacterium]|nr:EAL domain-containing protein [Rhodocyclaceae bacterium]
MTRTVRGLLVVCSTALAAGLFALGYFTFSEAYERSLRDDAVADAQLLARVSFSGMYQLMRTGWNRQQLETFLASLSQAADGTPARIEIYRSPFVTALYGEIDQPPPDAAILQAVRSGHTVERHDEGEVRYVMPLVAEEACLRCHANTAPGAVLGAVSVAQSIGPLIEAHRERFTVAGLPAIPITAVAVLLMVVYISRRLGHSIAALSRDIEAVNSVSDLKHLATRPPMLAFAEFAPIGEQISRLTERLRGVAVDRDMLEFEIRLLEKFIITSEVVRDWRDYVTSLLVEINTILPTYALFSIFKTGQQDYEIEVFWLKRPSAQLTANFEKALRRNLLQTTLDHSTAECSIRHNIADPSADLDPDEAQTELQTKTLVINAPKIGGIVGIGLQPDPAEDPARLLVIDSVLSTLLNVVGSVKAIHRYTSELEYFATRDPLTKLYNQRIFWELLENEIARAARRETRFVVLLVDVDNFKSINDSHGHAFGDSFLQAVARALRQSVRPDDIVARYGGDEFIALLPGASISEGSSVAERMIAAGARLDLLAPDSSIVKSGFTIGLAAFPEHARDAKDLFLLADNMLYKAKSESKGQLRVPTTDDLADTFRTAGERTLQLFDAIEARSFIPYFQPIVRLADGEIVAYEILSRLPRSSGTLGAEDFVPLAERMGVMHRIDLIVIRQALAQLSASGFTGSIFLNSSPRALVLEEFIPEIRRIVKDADIDARRIVFEITERETIRHPEVLDHYISRLTDEGFRLAIDDFGSGFSSFHYLKRFPVDYLKIEGEFVTNMLDNDRDRAMVRSIAALARELGICCLAEHIESEAVLEALRGFDIELGQGFHLGIPAPLGASRPQP